MNCNATSYNIHMRKIGRPQRRARACKCDKFHILDVAPVTLQSSRVRDDAHDLFHISRRTYIRDEYNTCMKTYTSARRFFVNMSWLIDSFGRAFVWAWKKLSCAMDCNVTSQTLHMGRARACNCDEFHVLGAFDDGPVTLQRSWVCADAQWSITHGSENLFRTGIVYRHEQI